MRAPGFWDDGGLPAWLLAPAGAVFGSITAWRMQRPGAKAPVPVVCVGNFTAGGAGKTPTAIAVAERLRQAGRRPVFLSRGYGGTVREPVQVDPARHQAAQVGDEPLLLARHGPTVVSPDRVRGAAMAAALGDVIVMDDGLQNPSLAKDLRLAVVDGAAGIGNGLCVPAGPLRAPLAVQLRHVDAVVLIGAGQGGADVAVRAAAAGVPILTGALMPDPAAAARLAGRRVLAFAGIGRPGKVFATLEALGATVGARHAFADHHAFTRAELDGLMQEAARGGLVPVTTEKDRVRLEGMLTPAQAAVLETLPVRLVLDAPEVLAGLLKPLRRS
ncbi:MAG: tetraacyldisaccharide 4'-kinase [Alsobacter sp.]